MTTTARQKERSAGLSALTGGVGALVIVVALVTIRILDTFRAEGIAWSIPIDAHALSVTVQNARIDGSAAEMTAVVAHLDAGGATAIIATISIVALAALIVIAALLILAANAARGLFFAPSSATALVISGWTIDVAACLHLLAEKAATNSVLQALGVSAPAPLHPVEFLSILPVIAVGAMVALIGIAFRHGIRLQRDTEGLV